MRFNKVGLERRTDPCYFLLLWEEFGFGAFEVKWNGKRGDVHPVTDAEAVKCLAGKAGWVFVRKETLNVRKKNRGRVVPGDGTETDKAEIQTWRRRKGFRDIVPG